MTSKSAHSARKSKLEPRKDVDDDDEIIRKLEEETNMAVMNISESINKYELNNSSKTPNNSFKMPVQLAVDIEVEACEETGDIEQSWFAPNTDSVAKKNCISIPDEIRPPVAEQNSLPPHDSAAYIDIDNLIKVTEEIIKMSNNPVNVSLAILTRSLWGKYIKKPHTMSDIDRKINALLDSVRTKEAILTYKCYICIQAWWNLHPFKEHIEKHNNVEILLERCHFVTNIVAYEKGTEKFAKPIHAFGDCYRCNKSFSRHIDMCGKYMKCYIGDQKASLPDRSERCTICRYVGNPNEHYVTCHSVRSDVPIETKVRTCKWCNEYYYVFTMHECKKKRTAVVCFSCNRYFSTGLCLELHVEIADKPYKCPYCSAVLPKLCAEPYHLLKHTSDFLTVELCIVCRGNLVFFSQLALSEHMLRKHGGDQSKLKKFMMIIPNKCYLQLKQGKFGFYEESASTSNPREEEIFDLTDNDAVDFDPSKVKLEYRDDDLNMGYEMLLSRVFNSSKTADNSFSTIKVESTVDEAVKIVEPDIAEIDFDEVKFTALSKPVEDTVNTSVDIEMQCNSNIENCNYTEINNEINKQDMKLENTERNTKKQIQDDVEMEDLDKVGRKNKYSVSDDDDVQIIEVKNDIVEIDDDIDQIDIEDIISVSSKITRVVDTRSNVEDLEEDYYNPNETVNEKSLCDESKSGEPATEIQNNVPESERLGKKCTEVEVHAPKETEVSIPNEIEVCISNTIGVGAQSEMDVHTPNQMEVQASNEIGACAPNQIEVPAANRIAAHAPIQIEVPVPNKIGVPAPNEKEVPAPNENTPNELKPHTAKGLETVTREQPNNSIPDYQIKIEEAIFENAGEENYFENSEYGDDDSDAGDRLRIAYSDSDNAEINTDDMTMLIDSHLFELKQPKLYRCACGYVSYHRPYKIHLTTCTVRKRYTKSETNVKKKSFKIVEEPINKDILSDINEFDCTKCDKKFSKLSSYLKHFVRHGYRRYTCPVCLLRYDGYKTMSTHMKVCHIKGNYFKSRSILIGETNSSFLGHHCKICKKQVRRKHVFTHWEEHFKLKDQEVPVKKESLLEVMQNTTMEKAHLKQIIDIMQPEYYMDKKLWTTGCLVCGHLVKRRSDYKRHLVEHLLADAQANRALYSALRCQICTHDVDKDRYFRDHVRDHACLAIYKCTLCNIEFSNSSNFSKHKKLHDPNALTCDICRKKFQSKTSIEKHMIVEHLDTTFSRACIHCDTVFTDKQLFRMHLKKKHKDKGFNCKVCKERFESVKQLWDHLWTVHKERRVTADCFLCGKQFRRFADLKAHAKRIHSVLLKAQYQK